VTTEARRERRRFGWFGRPGAGAAAPGRVAARGPFDPRPELEQRSLFGEILDWMLAPLLLLWPMSVGLTWVVAQNIANRPYDRDLAAMARTLAAHVQVQAEAGGGQRAVLVLPRSAAELLSTDETDDRFYQVLGLRGELLGGDRNLPAPALDERPAPGEIAYRNVEVDGRSVRLAVFSAPQAPATGTGAAGASSAPGAASTVAVIQVGETLGKRSQLATEIIKGVILPQFVILPLAVVLVWLALSRGIAPLNLLQQRIRRRESHDLRPIDEREAPEEVAPLVRAINDLLGRLDQSMATQKHFLADAAHQLKTPLAGLRMQAEFAQRGIDAGAPDLASVRRSLTQIAHSSENAARMVNQLLSMARAESANPARAPEAVDLVALAIEVVEDFVPRALDKRIDLGFERPAPNPGAGAGAGATQPSSVWIEGQPVLLRELIRNLVDNALHYTPAGGTVTVRLLADPFGQVALLQVEDSGPGVPAAERELIFQPFYRALGTNVDGSGLGLAIVREIAQQHGAEVSLTDATAKPRGTGSAGGVGVDVQPGGGPGARFSVRFRSRATPAQA
jgi:two-component system, OmpR family, sensor histidine kinase TctE